MLGSIARTTALLPLAALHVACSATPQVAAVDPYANCADLGDLSFLSLSQAEAEQRMRARVLELGGDTLLFGVRGRAGRLGDSPDEIVERRSRLMTPTPAIDSGPPPVVMTAAEAEQPDALETAESNAARRRTAAAAAANMKDAPGQLWFYGAALRCNGTDRTE